MSTTNFNVFIGANSTVQTFDDSATLADARNTLTSLGLMSSTDAFLYENPITELKTVFGPVSDEVNVLVSKATFPAVPSQLPNAYDLIQIVSTDANAPAFLGTTPPDGYFRPNGQMAVNVSLNTSDPDAVTNNAGMFQPMLLQNVQSANPDAPVSFSNCVIVQKGAIVSFNIASWGAAGWGYTITAAETLGGTNICDGLFIPYQPSEYGTSVSTTLNRYASGNVGDTIQIQSNASLNIAEEFNVEYSTITVNTYSLSSWSNENGEVYSSNLQIPSGSSDDSFMMFSLEEDNPGGWTPPPPAGGSEVPSNTTGSGTPSAGPPSTQTFGSPINSLVPSSCPATRSTGLVGSVEIYFLVFDSVEDANTIIKVLNAGTMQVN